MSGPGVVILSAPSIAPIDSGEPPRVVNAPAVQPAVINLTAVPALLRTSLYANRPLCVPAITGIGSEFSQQEVFLVTPDPLPAYPALVFQEVTIEGQAVHRMQVNSP